MTAHSNIAYVFRSQQSSRLSVGYKMVQMNAVPFKRLNRVEYEFPQVISLLPINGWASCNSGACNRVRRNF
jgi:hypothetical protein